MAKTKREYVDKPHKLMEEYYNLLDNIDNLAISHVKDNLKNIIKLDPQFLDPYLLLFEIYLHEGNFDDADNLLDKAYTIAIDLITDKDGNWPDILSWDNLLNRHIIRTILTKAIILWGDQLKDEALDIFKKLLESNPADHVGARFYILAIRLGIEFEDFDQRFNKGGYYDEEILTWFDENYKKFQDEFIAWEEKLRNTGIA